MSDEEYMKVAIEEAHESEKQGGLPLGVVMVKAGEIIAKGRPQVRAKMDPTAHGEIECIRNACKALQTVDLSSCTLYSTIETCSMCLGCAGWAGISKIVFGAYKEDAPDNPYELTDYHAEEHIKRLLHRDGSKTEVVGGILREECKELMKHIKNWTPV